MKPTMLTSAAVAAMVCGFAAESLASDWTLSGNALTEVGGSGWVLKVESVSGGGYSITGVTTPGSSGVIDLRGTIDGGTIANIGTSAFKGRSDIIEFYMPDTVTSVNADAFREMSALTTVRLSSTLESIGACAFYSSKKLAQVTPLLPESLKTIGDGLAFGKCPIEGDCLYLRNPDLKSIPDGDNNGGAFMGSSFKKVDMTGSGITYCGVNAFRGNKQLGEVIFSSALTTLKKNCSFYDCSALTNVVLASCPTDAASAFATKNEPFWGQADYKFRIQICMTHGDWDSVIASLGTTLNTGDANPSSAAYAKYKENFTDYEDVVPLGTINILRNCRWIAKYTEKATDVKFSVTGEPEAQGEGFVNGYGDYGVVTSGMTCSAPKFASLDGIYYECGGYKLQESGDNGWQDVESGTGLTYTFNKTELGNYRLVWQWNEAGYTLSIAEIPSALGSVSVSTPDIDGTYYSLGGTASVSVTPAAGKSFIRWYGDVDEVDAASTSIQLTMDGNKLLVPYVLGSWTYDSGAKTVSNGYWTFNTSGSLDALTVTSVKTAGVVTCIDFSTGLEGGAFAGISGTFYGNNVVTEVKMADTMTAIGENTFRQSSIQKVVLSQNLKTIGSCAFFRDESLVEVTPFLPDSVETIGSSAFYNCRNLVVPEFVLGKKHAATTFPQDGTYPLFFNVRFGRIDLSQSGLQTLGNDFQRNDVSGSLTEVRLPKTLTGMGNNSFRNQGSHTVFNVSGGPFTVTDTSFAGYGAMANAFVVPKSDAWVAYIDQSCSPETLSETEYANFATYFPSLKRPARKIKLPNVDNWQYLVWQSESGLTILVR